jgi:hyperosmotically inducible periplasmic protein
MKQMLLFTTVLALGLGAAAQTAPQSQATPALETNQAADGALSSNGPVTLDYSVRVAQPVNPDEAAIARKVRDQLLKLPYYSMFDDLEYSVQGRTVTLSGAVTSIHSQTKMDAERAVKRIEGVDKVVNNVQVLPPNPFDDQTRERVYRALALTGGLSRYFWPASPDIRILVANQRLTLKGYVSSEGDKNLATIAANQVRDLFQVTNELQVVR